jgi:hypothetical protein
VGVIIGGAVGGVVLLVGIGVGLFFGLQKPKPKQQQQPPLKGQARFHIPPNAALLYSNVPQQLYPVYPLRHIRVCGSDL